MKHSFFKKLIFFWLIFHSIAFFSFKFQWTPSFTREEGNNIITNYLLTPKYSEDIFYITSNRVTTKIENNMFPRCYNCNYNETDNFYPFHKFTYNVNLGYNSEKGFVGIFGFYGNNEFIVYVVIPLIFGLLTLLYRKLFKNN